MKHHQQNLVYTPEDKRLVIRCFEKHASDWVDIVVAAIETGAPKVENT